MKLRSHPVRRVSGRIRVPGDKSISHRALMLGAMAVGRTRVRHLLDGADVRATAGALRALGVEIDWPDGGVAEVHGVGIAGLSEPDRPLDLGNAGTAARLLLGLLAGHPFTSFLTGDDSLRSRPMGRVLEPLEGMGASFISRSGGRLPLAITGTEDLVPICHQQRVASAQVKSAVLLAGLHAPGRTSVIEPARSRDHTERMLRHFGAAVTVEPAGNGWTIALEGQSELVAADLDVPGDPSSAAFPLIAALALAGSEVGLEGIGVNPLRAGLFTTLEGMTDGMKVLDQRLLSGEPVADLEARGGSLQAVDVPADRAPSMIDEYPILAVAAAAASGTSRLSGLGELRVKESDRLIAIAQGLDACGVRCTIEGDDLVIEGSERIAGGALIDARHDHRIAMSFLVLGALAEAPVTVEGAETIQTSFPGFQATMNRLGCRIEEVMP
ncbi:MAG: 3-phosphoshikimate 1-carboxyvinyltransferase [Geminicoccaceae bacterium]|nr:3-phosphoshikimate 1-carboxyvinyltransferase [Geminicoccaceae bacterium]